MNPPPSVKIVIRPGAEDDVGAITTIYAHQFAMVTHPLRSSRRVKTICGSDVSTSSAAAFPISWPTMQVRS